MFDKTSPRRFSFAAFYNDRAELITAARDIGRRLLPEQKAHLDEVLAEVSAFAGASKQLERSLIRVVPGTTALEAFLTIRMDERQDTWKLVAQRNVNARSSKTGE